SSELEPLNPRDLPREIFVSSSPDPELPGQAGSTSFLMPEGLKKKGRPSKREKMKKAKDALAGLEKWLNKTTYTYSDGDTQPVASTSASKPVSTHILLSNPPMTSRNHYQTQKFSLLEDITSENSNAAALE